MMTNAFAEMAQLEGDARRQRGQELNEAKVQIEQALNEKLAAIGPVARRYDATLPGRSIPLGHHHPMTKFSQRVRDIWRSFGYSYHEGPELEEQWFNFDGLNVPKDHPARDVQDTFFIVDHPDHVLRTHASSVQLRIPVTHRMKPPFRYVEIGKVYRNEATDATHESMFFQCDGILVDQHVTMAHLVTTVRAFFEQLYPGKKIRVRPSFFPFVEPGIEVDLWWEAPGRAGRWLEVMGAGLTHPNVITAMGLDPKLWQGFAFGMGLDRLALIEFGIPDIRLLYSGNLPFLQQF
jgi:phenylalanyl-tRNA synthetase alpha chain